MTQLASSILMFVGLACLSSAVAVLVGTIAFRACFASSRNRKLAKELRFAEARKITRVNGPPPAPAARRRNTTRAAAESSLAYVPLRIRVRFRREEWRLKPADRLSHQANWN